ncbi:MAG: flavodoxin family protein [Candidatus Ratteibacteria bacterium]|nr:flavodoxin family protein [Candidatus Ratteibacteria bacterium]
MKILVISASPRKEKSQTLLLAKGVLKGCEDSNTAEIIHLCEQKIEFCRHCEHCHRKILACILKDDVHKILDMMLEADGIILATPNYIDQVTGAMKTLFDRSTHFLHCLRLMGRYTAGVVSSGSGADKDVLSYLKHYTNACGAYYVGGISTRVPVGEEALSSASKLGKRLCRAIRQKKEFPSQTRIIEGRKNHFRKILQTRKNEWEEEYRYWADNNWL